MKDTIKLTGYIPGAIGRITELHGTYYAENWDLGLYFEATVAKGMADFLMNFDDKRDAVWFAQIDGKIVGGIFIVSSGEETNQARLRWFIVDPAYQGYGIGKRLMTDAIEFCHKQQFDRVYLTTFAGLDTARHLYEKHGFVLCGETDGEHLTGKASLTEQIFEYILDTSK